MVNQTFGKSASGFRGGQVMQEYINELAMHPQLVTMAVSTDNISVPHTFKFCTPIPTDNWNRNVEPGTKDCGIFEKYLSNFPANDTPSGGSSTRISPSEMAYLYMRFDNYPYKADVVKQQWVRDSDNTVVFEYSYPVYAPDPSWSWYYMWLYSFIGHFDWEINAPGNYHCNIITPWGTARIDFKVYLAPVIATVYDIVTAPVAPFSGDAVKITASIANTLKTGNVRAVFKVNGTQVSDQSSTLSTFPGGGLWNPTATFTMPTGTATISIEAYGWDGSKWVLTDTKSITRTPSVIPCSTVSISPFSASVTAGQKVQFTATVTPSTSPITVQFKDRAGNLLGTCKSSGGTCTYTWDTTGIAAGTYYVKAYAVEGSCVSTESTILVSPPIPQWNVNVTVRDSVTNNPVGGATVTLGTQGKLTDATGFVQFRIDQGTIDVSISKTGYNTFTTVELVFTDKSFNYMLSPAGMASGSIHFVSLPLNAGIFIDNTDQGVKTNYTVTNIPAGEHTFTLKLAGYNDFTGKVMVLGGSVVEVYVVLTAATPGAGALYIASTPIDADITMDGQPQNIKTPYTIANIPAGSHEVKLSKAGYQDLTQTVTITAGITTYLNVSLAVLAGIGTLEISSIPAGARIFLDGKDAQKVTPATITNLSSGDHTYKLVLSGYKDATAAFTIEPGKTVTVPVTLTKAGTGTGAIVALGLIGAGVMGAVVLSSGEKKPEYMLPKHKGGIK